MRVKISAILFALVLGLGAGLSYSSPGESAQKKPRKGKEESSRSDYYKKWLKEDVFYIISEDESRVFKDLQNDEERESFIEQFWVRRDPDPRTPDNEFKEEHYRRIVYANERFHSGIPGWKTDRGRTYITFGPPVEIESHPTGGTYDRPVYEGGGTTSTYAFEKWRYRHIDGIGDDIEIEFVDRSNSNEYRMAMMPEEKDALFFVPNAGLTEEEMLGQSTKADRPYFNPERYTTPNSGYFYRAKDQPFERMDQYFKLQRPPAIKFDDLKSVVTASVSYNLMPFDLRLDFIRLSKDKVLVPITIEVQNKNLEFKKELDFNRASVNVYGLVTGLTGRILAEFEHEIAVEYIDQFFEQGKQNRSIYQKIVALPPGQRFKLDLVLKDVNSKNTGTLSRGINVPKFDGDKLEASSIILANTVTQAPASMDQLEQFVIGDLKVQPNVKAEYNQGQTLIPYLQVYNAAIDQTSLKPSVEITYTIKSGDKVIEELKDLGGSTVQFFSGQRVVVLGKIPLKAIPPGKYSLAVKVMDMISNAAVDTETEFKVNAAIAAATTTASSAISNP
jgi:GWxTD domain-containing protein